ncbi:MAG: hypothetical protein U0835_04345 [Isosphaeraceae bacterium]
MITRHNRLGMSVLGAEGKATTVWIAVRSGPRGGSATAQGLARELGRAFSSHWASVRLESLRTEGREAEFRVRPCPHCGASLDLTGFPETPQVYCRYCDSISTSGPSAPTGEEKFHRCDGCGYYSVPKVFSSTVVVFALAVVVWWSNRRYYCRSCMKREAWKTFFKNLPTLVGAPFALVQLARSYLGGAARTWPLAGLDAANRAGASGKLERAERTYQEILTRVPHAAGVHYNRAKAHAQVRDWAGCVAALDRVWADCPATRRR